MRVTSIVIAAAGLLVAGYPSKAQNFYRSKTIKLVVSSQVGASYDSYARILARHMPRHIPGQPGIVVQNAPGAEGLMAANNLYNAAERDGTTIGVLNRATVLASLIGNEQVRFKSEQFNWLGTAASFEDNAYLFVIKATLPYLDVESLRTSTTPLHVGNSGSPLVTLLKHGLHLNIKLVEGYGRNTLDLAFERGEVDGVGIAYANLIARRPTWIKKQHRPPLDPIRSHERFALLPDVPTGREIARNEEERVWCIDGGKPADRLSVRLASDGAARSRGTHSQGLPRHDARPGLPGGCDQGPARLFAQRRRQHSGNYQQHGTHVAGDHYAL